MPNQNALVDWPTPRLVFIWIAVYLTLHVLLRLTLGETLETDEAEQMLLGQWFLAGYDGQPPLYTWLQHGLFSLFGHSLATLSVFKNLLQLITCGFIFLSARRLCGRDSLAALATLSMIMIPQFAWESQRDLTHTPLVVCLAAASLFGFLVAVERKHLIDYATLGILLGLGLLTKHNYVLFAGCLVVTGLTTGPGRKLLLDRRTAITVALAVAISSSYVSWFIGNADLATSSAHKLGTEVRWERMSGLKDLIVSAIAYLTPLWIALLFFPLGYLRLGRNLLRGRAPYHLERYLPILFTVLVLAVLILGVTHFKDRWMHPVLFLFPALFFAGLPANTDPRRVRWYTFSTLFMGTSLLVAMFAHVVAADLIGKHPSRNFPFPAIADQIRASGFERGLIVGENGWVAGNLKYLLPESKAVAPGFVVPREHLGRFEDGILLAWETDERQAPPPKLLVFARDRLGLPVDPIGARFLTDVYQYSDTATGTIGILRIPAWTLPPASEPP